ncbi:MAG TPA: family 16 glycoside hydrolase [Thermoanaerobaculia bacterium]|nr:family 16 glycoside hydrolase [Thermoanaerobaculia bacterium]
MAIEAEYTSFSRDVLGRFICNHPSEVSGRPFDAVIIGGGTFGAVIAEHLWFRGNEGAARPRPYRVIVLEAGNFVLPEHVQNIGLRGLDPPGPTRLDDYRKEQNNAADPLPPRNQVWGTPWLSDVPFTGLAYCLGGRSLYWGGWSPQLLHAEMATWPSELVAQLEARYFGEATRQIGVDAANDFIFGELHSKFRQLVHDKLAGATAAIPLAELPNAPGITGTTPTAELLARLGLAGANGMSDDDLRDLLKIEAPLAVQAQPPHAGFFPMNKFSAVPLLVKAARTASAEDPNDATKSFMVVPQTHVKRLALQKTSTGTFRVTGVDTSRGFFAVDPAGVVVIALGTIESARLAKESFRATDLPTRDLIGRNLMAHLRSNLNIRVPRSAIPGLLLNELQTSALFVKGRHDFGDGKIGHFHLQITATGGPLSTGSEDELFRKIPDVDFYQQLATASDTHVAITFRGIGEMEPADPANPQAHPNFVDLKLDSVDEHGIARANVTLHPTARDLKLWETMDKASDALAKAITGDSNFQVIIDRPNQPQLLVDANKDTDLSTVSPYKTKKEDVNGRRDGTGTTHHETGTLWMGTDPAKSVTDPDGRFHHTVNLYAAGPALFPTIGSPNPMLTGIAVARRTGDRIIAPPPDENFESLFDGRTLKGWRMSTIRNQPGRDDPGRFVPRGGVLEAVPGTDLGLLWHTKPAPANFILRAEWMMTSAGDNSGIFVRFPHPEEQNFDNTAYVAVRLGMEIQIDELARPDGSPRFRTGAIYDLQGPTGTLHVRPPGEWNAFEIRVENQTYTVRLNGDDVTTFTFTEGSDAAFPKRGLPSTPAEPRFIGLQTHTGRVLYRRIQIRAL